MGEEIRTGPKCPVSAKTPQNVAMTRCGHFYCEMRICDALRDAGARCPVCHEVLFPSEVSDRELTTVEGKRRGREDREEQHRVLGDEPALAGTRCSELGRQIDGEVQLTEEKYKEPHSAEEIKAVLQSGFGSSSGSEEQPHTEMDGLSDSEHAAVANKISNNGHLQQHGIPANGNRTEHYQAVTVGGGAAFPDVGSLAGEVLLTMEHAIIHRIELNDRNVGGLQRAKSLIKLSVEQCSGKIRLHSAAGGLLLLEEVHLGGFNSIENVDIYGLPKLNKISIKGMNEVKEIRITGCEHLQSIEGVENITQLKSIKINKQKTEQDAILTKQKQKNTITNKHTKQDRKQQAQQKINNAGKNQKCVIHGLHELCGLTTLQELCLAEVSVDDAFLRDLTCHERLRELSLNSCTRITDVSPLARMRSLEMLDLNGCTGIVRGLHELCGLTTLQELYLRQMSVDDALLRDLTCHERLRELSLNSCTRITDVSPLARMRSLEMLDLNGCTGIVRGLHELCGLTTLQELYLRQMSVDDALLRDLTCHERLRELSLNSCTRITDVSPLARMRSLEILNLNDCTGIVRGLHVLCGLTTLQKLCLANVNVDDAFLRDLTCHERLRELSLNSCTRITDVSPLARMRSLEMLNLNDCTGIVRGLHVLCGLTTLQELCLANVNVDDAFVRDLTCHERLRRLSLNSCTRITDVSPLARMRSLEMLNLNDCTGIVRGLHELCGLTTLQELYLPKVYVDDAFLRDLTCHERLRRLSLNSCTRITDVSPLARMRSLEMLNLNGCTGIVRGLHELCGLTTLQELYLRQMSVDDAFLRDLTCHERLRRLSLNSCTRITDVSPLARMRSLEMLNLNDCTGIVRGLHVLCGLTTLQELCLANVNVDDAFVRDLTCHERLRRLSLNSCTRITDVSPLARMRSLEMLNLNDCTGIVRGLHELCGLTTLQELYLPRCMWTMRFCVT
ncbi:hypothetical protein ERJ75_000928400 [Trypanosoma vivax]|nr:hypothetical protein ERJ75_000928400 [Trypanosoma vivax]